MPRNINRAARTNKRETTAVAGSDPPSDILMWMSDKHTRAHSKQRDLYCNAQLHLESGVPGIPDAAAI